MTQLLSDNIDDILVLIVYAPFIGRLRFWKYNAMLMNPQHKIRWAKLVLASMCLQTNASLVTGDQRIATHIFKS